MHTNTRKMISFIFVSVGLFQSTLKPKVGLPLVLVRDGSPPAGKLIVHSGSLWPSITV